MGQAEIDELIAAYVAAARRSKESGLDGIEIHWAHGHIIHQFLSPITNVREDHYGGGLDNHMRFAVEVLRAVRGEVGCDFPLGIRLSVSTVEGGVTEDDLIHLAATLETEGLIDYVYLSVDDPSRLRMRLSSRPALSPAWTDVGSPIPGAASTALSRRMSRARSSCLAIRLDRIPRTH
jgi:2,4-dienoyl-CoA reductase-like NADH-dependent reductase (Old Yellow Enzyme family)